MSGRLVGWTRAALAVAAVLVAVRVAPAGATSAKGDAPRAAVAAKEKAPPAAEAATASAPASGPQVRGFQTFCDSWMQKLRDRETYNTSHITWDRRDGLVTGEHVAYGHECSCEAREETGKDPIGKITYREMRYRRQGLTPAEALAVPGTIVEQTDVTEIFRYAKGAWQY